MRLSASNIAWTAENDEEMYEFLSENGYSGLEIAPTRIFPESPYDCDISAFLKKIKDNYNLNICSMQSIWYGISESIFGSYEDRQRLIAYTKKAIDFAAAAGCKNLVFGCPKNRNIPNEMMQPLAVEFFRELGGYAFEKGTCIAIEPNPVIYNTNFLNTTSQAIDFCKEVSNQGIRVNVDLGTIIYNEENLSVIKENISFVNHVHISEPYLEKIEVRELHKELRLLEFNGYISIEMKNTGNLEDIKRAVLYCKNVLAGD